MRSFKLKDGKLSFDIQVTIIQKRLLRRVVLCDVSFNDEEDGRKLGLHKQESTDMFIVSVFQSGYFCWGGGGLGFKPSCVTRPIKIYLTRLRN